MSFCTYCEIVGHYKRLTRIEKSRIGEKYYLKFFRIEENFDDVEKRLITNLHSAPFHSPVSNHHERHCAYLHGKIYSVTRNNVFIFSSFLIFFFIYIIYIKYFFFLRKRFYPFFIFFLLYINLKKLKLSLYFFKLTPILRILYIEYPIYFGRLRKICS